MALESARDQLLGRALRRMRERRGYRRLGFARWADYVAERLGCELRWAQYLVRMDTVGERYPELQAAVAAGVLSPLKVIHISRLLTGDMPEARRRALITAAATLTVRELEKHVQQLRAEDRAGSTLAELEAEALASSAVPNPWDPGPGSWLSFPASGRALELFSNAAELACNLAGENLPRHVSLEYMVADRFSAIGWSPDLDQDARADERERRVNRLRAEDRARAELTSIGADDDEGAALTERGPVPTKRQNRFQRRALRLRQRLLTRDLDPDSATTPRDLDRIIQKLEALDRTLRPVLGQLLAAIQALELHRDLGCASFKDYCAESLGLDPRRVTRLMRFREGLDQFPALATAYQEGRLRYLQVIALLPIVVPKTACAWINWAAASSVRDTRAAIDRAWLLALTQEHSDGTTFACLDGVEVELPAGIPLPPFPGTRQPRLSGASGERKVEPSPIQYPFRIFLPGDLAAFVRAGLRSCRDDRDLPLPEGEALAVLAAGFLMNLTDPVIQRQIEDYTALDRDGWQCSVPTCTFRAVLNEHHIWFVIHGGPDVDSNKTALCFVHHIILLHGLLASISVSGTAPDELEWQIGRSPGEPPLLLFRGHRKIQPDEELDRSPATESPPPMAWLRQLSAAA